MEVEKILQWSRLIAKGNYYQTIYSQEKSLGLTLFENGRELTLLQINFLNFLSMYSGLYLDIALGEISTTVLDNVIYEDAYLYYRNQTRMEKMEDKAKEPIEKGNSKQKVSETQWIFKSKKNIEKVN